MAYDAKGLLLRKFFTDVNSEPDSVIQYGENEAWSIEFRKSLNSNSVGFFDFQESKFILNKAKKFEKIKIFVVFNIKRVGLNTNTYILIIMFSTLWLSISDSLLLQGILTLHLLRRISRQVIDHNSWLSLTLEIVVEAVD